MTNSMREYVPSNPGAAANAMRNLRGMGMICPLCRRVGKWRYYYYEPTSQADSDIRCTMHEIVPIPGPSYEPDVEKVSQLY